MVKARALVFGLAMLAACLVGAHGALAEDRDIPERDASLQVVIDPLPATPYDGEMVLVTIRGIYDVTIALESLQQPELRNFGWTQLGRDSWGKQRIAGREMTVFERRLALYPHGSGTLTISPFVHHLTLVAANGDRFVHDVVSKPVELKVEARPAANGNWWLPARNVTYSDVWDRDPGMLGNGETATRTVTITAVGVPPNALPPPPKMVASWLIAFMAPERRSVELTKENGPVSTVVWQWRFRPARSEPGRMKAFHIPWFDTQSRQARDIVLGSQRIAFAAIAAPKGPGRVAGLLTANAGWLAALAGALMVLALLLPGLKLKSQSDIAALMRRMRPDPDRRRLKRAADRGDWPGARIAVKRLVDKTDPAAADPIAADRRREALAAIDRRLYARKTTMQKGDPALHSTRSDPGALLDLKRLARMVLARHPA